MVASEITLKINAIIEQLNTVFNELKTDTTHHAFISGSLQRIVCILVSYRDGKTNDKFLKVKLSSFYDDLPKHIKESGIDNFNYNKFRTQMFEDILPLLLKLFI